MTFLWPWRHDAKKKLDPDPEFAQQAREEAARLLAEARARQPRVDEAVAADKKLRRENHFGPSIARALGADTR